MVPDTLKDTKTAFWPVLTICVDAAAFASGRRLERLAARRGFLLGGSCLVRLGRLGLAGVARSIQGVGGEECR